MKTDKPQASPHSKWEVSYVDDDCKQIWKYDLNKFANGPISVETVWSTNIVKEWKEGKKLKSVRKKKK